MSAGAIDHEDAYNASRAHIQLFVLQNFSAHLSTLSCTPELERVLSLLKDLFFTTIVLNDLGSLYMFLTTDQITAIRNLRDVLLKKVSVEAVGIVDAFDFDDWYLDSAIGNSKGDVYQQVYDMMRSEPLNVEGVGMKDGVAKGWFETLQQVVDGKLGVFNERKSKL